MDTIYKFELAMHTKMMMPKGSEILKIGTQRDNVVLWARLDTEAEPVEREFIIYCTGQSINPVPMNYLGTAAVDNDRIVLHVFEVLK